MRDDLSEKIAALAARSAVREAQHSSAMRQHFDGSEFARLYRDLKSQFGPGTRIVWFKCPAGEYGQPGPPRVPLSDPAPVPLGKKGKR